MNRHRFQGVWTVLRFNWHFFALADVGIAASLLASPWLPPPWQQVALALAGIASLTLGASLAATYIAYDATGLHRLDWLSPWMPPSVTIAANIHAGFDETSATLTARFPRVAWSVFDFYDPAKHTEISIRRARAAHPPRAGTVAIATPAIPLPDASIDRVLLLLAAHEIRDHGERVAFFRELHRTLRTDGHVIVTEHLRDAANIAAYNVGAWHFHPPREWLATFQEAGFAIVTREKLNPFITLFVLRPA